MDGAEHCYSVLLVSASEKSARSIRTLLPENRYGPVVCAADAAGARRRLTERSFDLVIVNSPLPDDFGVLLAQDICERSAMGVLLLVRAEHYPDVQARLSPCGVFVLSKPCTGQIIAQSLTLVCATRERLRRLEKKTASLEEKMEDIRIINRAKWQLIEQLKMTEAQAHRFIEKQAMDRCVSKRAVAEDILSAYK